MTRREQFPIGTAVSPHDLTGDVHPLLHRLRTAEPVTWLPALDAWFVTRMDLCIEVMRDAHTFTVDHPGFSTAQVIGPSMLSRDGSAHRAHRDPFERPFRRHNVHARFDPAVAQHVTDLLDRLAPQGRAELRRDLAGPVAVKTMLTALGLPQTAVAQILRWYDDIVAAVTAVTAGEPVSAAGRAAFAALQDRLLPALSQSPGDNLLAAAGAAHTLTETQIISNAAVLLFGGIETTEGMIANALYYLLTNQDVMQQVREAPELGTAVIEETVRLEPAAAVVDRYATRDVTLETAEIRAGELVRVSLTAANRDPAVFPHPDHFQPGRPNLSAHVAFAQGPHVCLGLHLARLEAAHTISQTVARLPNLRLAADPAAAQPRGLVFRKPAALPVTWDANQAPW